MTARPHVPAELKEARLRAKLCPFDGNPRTTRPKLIGTKSGNLCDACIHVRALKRRLKKQQRASALSATCPNHP